MTTGYQSMILSIFSDRPLYVGAERSEGNTGGTKWTWANERLPIDLMMWIKYDNEGDCAVTREVVNQHHRHSSEYGLENVNCSASYRPLCQLFLHV